MRTLLTAAMLLLTGACSAIGGDRAGAVQASGANGRRDFSDVGAFSKVELAGSYKVVVAVGGAQAVRAEGDEAALERLEVRVEGGTLHVGAKPGNWRDRGNATVYVTAPSLDSAAVAGSGDMEVGPFRSAQFSGAVAGSGNLTLARLESDRAQLNIAGSGNLRAEGRAGQVALQAAGSGEGRLAGFEAENATVSVSGSGNVQLRATRRAEVRAVGSGDVVVTGGAQCAVTSMGSGEVHCS